MIAGNIYRCPCSQKCFSGLLVYKANSRWYFINNAGKFTSFDPGVILI